MNDPVRSVFNALNLQVRHPAIETVEIRGEERHVLFAPENQGGNSNYFEVGGGG